MTNDSRIKIGCSCNDKRDIILPLERTNLVKCTRCNLVFADVTVSPRELLRIYEGWKYEKITDSPIERDNCAARMDEIERIVPGHQKKRILDFGTGDSNFLYVARARGWDVFGIDANKTIARIHQRNGIPIIATKHLQDRFFDVITLFHVFEHLPEPETMLRLLRTKLRPGGIIVIDVPNIDSVAIKLFKENAGYIDREGTQHLYYYSLRTLSAMLERNGFRPIKRNYKGISGITQFADVKEKLTGSRSVTPIYRYMKPAVFVYRHASAFLRISDCLQVIARVE